MWYESRTGTLREVQVAKQTLRNIAQLEKAKQTLLCRQDNYGRLPIWAQVLVWLRIPLTWLMVVLGFVAGGNVPEAYQSMIRIGVFVGVVATCWGAAAGVWVGIDFLQRVVRRVPRSNFRNEFAQVNGAFDRISREINRLQKEFYQKCPIPAQYRSWKALDRFELNLNLGKANSLGDCIRLEEAWQEDCEDAGRHAWLEEAKRNQIKQELRDIGEELRRHWLQFNKRRSP